MMFFGNLYYMKEIWNSLNSSFFWYNICTNNGANEVPICLSNQYVTQIP